MDAQEKVHQVFLLNQGYWIRVLAWLLCYIIYLFIENNNNNNNQQKKNNNLKSPVWRAYDEIKAGLAGCCVMHAFNDDTLFTVRTKMC